MNFLEESQQRFPGWFDYQKTKYVSRKLPLILTCKVHGDFQITPKKHLSLIRGCPACGVELRSQKRMVGNESIIQRLRQLHGDTYDLTRIVTGKTNVPVEVGCPRHGWVTTSLKNFLKGQGPCLLCKGAHISQAKAHRGLECIQRDIDNTHHPEYTYDLSTFTRYSHEMRIVCPTHGEFWQKPLNHFPHLQGCPRCGSSTSRGENEVFLYLESLGVSVTRRNRVLIAPLELDIYLPDFKVAIEYNGMYWHADDRTHKVSLKKKWELCQERGIRLINLFEHEWEDHQPAVKSLLRSAVHQAGTIGARKFQAQVIEPSQAKPFLDLHHIAGFRGSKLHVGLFLEQELFAVASFGASRFEDNTMELIRYASKCHISGGLKRLIKIAQEELRFTSLTSYCDMRHGTGNSYLSTGFEFHGITSPDYWWFKGKKFFPRYRCQKHKLAQHPEFAPFYSPEKTENQICQDAGFRKVTGVGHSKFVFTPG